MDKKKTGLIVTVLLILIFLGFTVKWIDHRMKYIISDAVFVETEYMSNIGFYRVSGRVIQLFKKEGDYVKADEEMAKIDDTDYKTQIQIVEKKIQSLVSEKAGLEKQLQRVSEESLLNSQIASLSEKEIEKRIASLSAQVLQLDAQINLAKKDEERYRNLLEKGLIPKRKYEEIVTNLDVLQKQKLSLEKNISELKISKEKAQKNAELSEVHRSIVQEISNQIESIENQIEALKKEKEDIENQLRYTVLKAPFDGVVAKKFVSIGDVVKPGQPVYSLVRSDSFYIKVLLEENKLKGLKVGNKAYIRLDAYPDEVFEGVVESIDIATAAKFALVPRDISAGEFTKLAQRVPVKIKIVKGDKSLLRVGLGGEVEIEKSR